MRFVVLLIVSLLLVSCSDDITVDDPYADWTATDFYDEAKDALRAGEFETAIKHLESLEARFPFSPYARQAQLDVAYAYYKFEEYDSAIAAIERFLRLNPRDKHVDYAWYLKGLSNFNRGAGLMDAWFPRDMSKHDSQTMHDAISDFSTLVRRFPDSRYAADAYQRLIFLRNELAEHEIQAARYYVKRQAWLAAARRGQYVLEHYPTTPSSRDALDIMIEAYKNLGLSELEADARKIREKNTPKQDASKPQFKELEQEKS